MGYTSCMAIGVILTVAFFIFIAIMGHKSIEAGDDDNKQHEISVICTIVLVIIALIAFSARV